MTGSVSPWHDRRNFLAICMMCLAAVFFLPHRARGSTGQTYTLNLKKHLFDPNRLVVPKAQPFTLHVINGDNHPEEFESYDLEFEIIVLPHHSIDVPVRPLPPGTYEFFGDFHPRTARGTITVNP